MQKLSRQEEIKRARAYFELSWRRFAVQLQRERHRLRFERHYAPNQPRVPAGNPDGGQWTDWGLGGGLGLGLKPERETVRVAGPLPRDESFYSIDLAAEDAKGYGAHGFKKHVGKNAAELLQFVRATNYAVRGPGGLTLYRSHPAEGSFTSESEANYFTSRVLRENAAKVEQVIRDKDPKSVGILQRFGFPTGIEAHQPTPDDTPVVRTTYSVEVYIRYDPTPGRREYRVMTAYPMNETHDETN